MNFKDKFNNSRIPSVFLETDPKTVKTTKSQTNKCKSNCKKTRRFSRH